MVFVQGCNGTGGDLQEAPLATQFKQAKLTVSATQGKTACSKSFLLRSTASSEG